MSMIERVARELQECAIRNMITRLSEDDAKLIARAAIEAMMEPTEAMIEAGRAVPCDDEISGGVIHSSATEVRAIWKAMLQSALHGDQEG